MSTSLTYAVKFVADMHEAVRFHVEKLELKLRFESPEWSEFETGTTTLALHVASPQNPAGSCQLGFGVPDVQRFYDEAVSRGVRGTSPPTRLHGQQIAKLQYLDGAEFSVGGP